MYVKTATAKFRCNAKHRGCVHGSRISILRYGGITAVNENVCICMTPHNWEHVICKGSSFYFHKEVWLLGLKFHLNLHPLKFVLCVQHSSILLNFIDHGSFRWTPLPLLSCSNKKSNTTRTSHETFSELKQVHVGMEPSKTSQTRWEWCYNTFTPFLYLKVLSTAYYDL